MSYEFKPPYYEAKVAKEDEIQAELFKGGVESPGVFIMEMRLKWERLCIEQKALIPDRIPNAWKRRNLEEVEGITSKSLNFIDCSREMAA